MKNEIVSFLTPKVTQPPSINESFKDCSYDQDNDRYLVKSTVTAINFDKLTKRLGHSQNRKSADALTITDENIFLIEFKNGNQVKGEHKIPKLVTGVSGKINDSDLTLFEDVFENVFEEENQYPKIKFYVVVDSVAMGADVYALQLSQLSTGQSTNPYEQRLFNQILPNWKSNCQHPQHFDEIDIWYSELFDTYLSINKIKSLFFA